LSSLRSLQNYLILALSLIFTSLPNSSNTIISPFAPALFKDSHIISSSRRLYAPLFAVMTQPHNGVI